MRHEPLLDAFHDPCEEKLVKTACTKEIQVGAQSRITCATVCKGHQRRAVGKELLLPLDDGPHDLSPCRRRLSEFGGPKGRILLLVLRSGAPWLRGREAGHRHMVEGGGK